ncbi:MAG: energy-coupling factor transporter ATPase [Clostridia bacterium]|nr:energy-coupling factor transporter ATPase [Clostridia bacterium]
MSKIELQTINYLYGKGTPFEVHALQDVSISVREGTVTGIIGHTGSGKSTLVQLLNGLTKPESGLVLLDGKDIWEDPKKIRNIRFRVGLVMQYPEYQLFEETVRADIAFGPKNMGLSAEEIETRVREACRFAGLDEALLDASPFDLSGGQKRRVAIAGVMAMRPEVLVLDEPAAGLDPRGRDAILRGMKEYRDRSGATVIIVSHSMEDMARFCDDVIVMAHARVLMQGSCREVFARAEELSAVGLDIPEISTVCRMLRERGVPVEQGIYTVEDAVHSLAQLLRGEGGQAK